MRLTAGIVVLGAGAIAGAQLSNIPQCSLTCFTSTLGGDGCSELTDFACHCQKPGLAAEIVPCVNKACDIADRQAVSSLVESLCSGVGHPVSIPAMDTSTTSAGVIPTTAMSSNSTAGSGFGTGFKTSSTINAALAQSTSQFNGASSIAPGAVPMVGSAILLAGMIFFV
ncbi:hypothetical protein N7449_009319 [Penicillium cf. viridicatum]|uniref:CFEM domain-containing protein n=1 Tax=Penicillium cf. viridicatum TaxID=2972119 RepID=A0A9W9MAJ2_9EURO|nr:hypothetical protein N7449_009319 [Penicillium cf. viridicatum]